MCKVFIIAGKTGAGKSTISEWLYSQFGISNLSFYDIGKSFANKHGEDMLRNCYKALGHSEFRRLLVDDVRERVYKAINDNHVLVIDGLYAYDVILDIQDKCKVVIIYLQANDFTRYTRISKRLEDGNNTAAEEDKLKDEIKQILGNDTIIKSADYVIDGNLPLETVKEEVYEIVSKEICSCDKCIDN